MCFKAEKLIHINVKKFSEFLMLIVKFNNNSKVIYLSCGIINGKKILTIK